MAVRGAVNFSWPWVVSMNGPPNKMNTKDGRKVKKVTTEAARAPDQNSPSAPSIGCSQPPRNPTKATTMISGPGVVSPSARPSIICWALSQPKSSTAPWNTYGKTA